MGPRNRSQGDQKIVVCRALPRGVIASGPRRRQRFRMENPMSMLQPARRSVSLSSATPLGPPRIRACAAAPLALLLACGAVPPDDLSGAEGALRVCPAGATVEGIDVSVYQGSIDWARVAGSGVAFGV